MKIKNKYLEICNRLPKKLGGHWQALARILNIEYLMLGFCKFNFGHRQAFYDIMHHEICLGFISISWGEFAFDWDLS